MKKALFAAILTISFVFSTCVLADECPNGGVRCGTTDDGLSWEITNIKDENGNYVTLPSGEIAQELTITGTGDMQDYTRHWVRHTKLYQKAYLHHQKSRKAFQTNRKHF